MNDILFFKIQLDNKENFVLFSYKYRPTNRKRVGVTSPSRNTPNFRQMSPDLSASKGMSTPCSPPANLQNGHVVRQGAGRCLPTCCQAGGCSHRPWGRQLDYIRQVISRAQMLPPCPTSDGRPHRPANQMTYTRHLHTLSKYVKMPADVSSLGHKQGDMINTVQSPRPPANQHRNSTLSFRQIKIHHIRKVTCSKHDKKTHQCSQCSSQSEYGRVCVITDWNSSGCWSGNLYM